MAQYSRVFITLKSDSTGYGINNRMPSGRSIIEIRGNTGKVSVLVQDMKPNIIYRVYIISVSDSSSRGLPIGIISVDNKGKGELRVELDPLNVNGYGIPLEEFNVVSVFTGGDKNSMTPLVGYKDEILRWKNNFIDLMKQAEKNEKENNKTNNEKNQIPTHNTEQEKPPIETPKIEEPSVNETPTKELPVEEVPAEKLPLEEAPIEEPPIEEAPSEEPPIEEPTTKEAPTQEIPIEETSSIEMHTIETNASEITFIEYIPPESTYTNDSTTTDTDSNSDKASTPLAQPNNTGNEKSECDQDESAEKELPKTEIPTIPYPDMETHNLQQLTESAPEQQLISTPEKETAPENILNENGGMNTEPKNVEIKSKEIPIYETSSISSDIAGIKIIKARRPLQTNIPEHSDSNNMEQNTYIKNNKSNLKAMEKEEYKPTDWIANANKINEHNMNYTIHKEETVKNDIFPNPILVDTNIDEYDINEQPKENIEKEAYAKSSDFYGEDTKETSEQDKLENIHETFKAMARKFNRELRELEYYKFLSEEDLQGLYNIGSKENVKATEANNFKIKDEIAFLFDNNATMVPFKKQNKPVKWVRISLKELALLPIDFWEFMNHPFIISSYKKNNHLILGMEEKTSSPAYFLGVPSIYESGYRLNANKLGFSQFKYCDEIKTGEGSHGYWLTRL